jgi:hypothetical protein
MSDQAFHQIAAEQGEEAAIRVGIAGDPDTMELDEEWFSRARSVPKKHLMLLKRAAALARDQREEKPGVARSTRAVTPER